MGDEQPRLDDQRTDRDGGRMKQFSIRDLLFVIMIVALVLGWWLDRRPIPARFQMQTVSGANGTNAYVLDTATGQVWDEHTPGFGQAK